ncbi:MAG: hypothetical protein OPY08_05115 [Nitrosopumilus sp.]|nr:hypothetical protein [Nitrosopumilus sp.]MDF2426499.1 hypothetical protein [Nitrosopumilus sp.]MDF2429102.1 hypothetical protein [Nitrosopumilus sp.]
MSDGKQRALYHLNIIFEVEARKNIKQETLFIIDDISDSFDYHNKYAIIQYLKEMSDEPLFKLIILTHNFDFFRTVHSREIADYSKCFFYKTINDEVKLEQVKGLNELNLQNFDSTDSFGSKSLPEEVFCIDLSPFIFLMYWYTVSRETPNVLAVSVMDSGYGLEPLPVIRL